MKEFATMAVLAISLQSGFAQEPFTYKPEDIPKQDVPEGLTAEEYIQQVYHEWHFPMKLTLRVQNEEGDPLEGALVNVGLDSRLHADGHNNYVGKSDSEGLFTVEGRGSGSSDVSVTKDGYYTSRPDIRWSGALNNDRELMKKVGFRPWNPTIDVVLRKVGNPIPMRVWLGGTDGAHRVPGLNEEFGFDLFEKDWVKPHGNGKQSDLFVKCISEFKDQNDYKTSCFIRFANPNDGFLPVPELVSEESRLKYPREAPLNGYVLKELKIEANSSGAGIRIDADKKEPIGYLVRFRSVKDDKTGRITSALYGKIVSPLDASTNSNPFKILPYMWVNREIDKTPRLQFWLYLNPNLNERNLEYDQQTNLAPNAPKGVTWLP